VFKVAKESALNVLSSREKNDMKRGDKGQAEAVRRSMEGAAIKRLYRTRPKCDRIAQFLKKRKTTTESAAIGRYEYVPHLCKMEKKWPNGDEKTAAVWCDDDVDVVDGAAARRTRRT
jgi:hypothetical protein